MQMAKVQVDPRDKPVQQAELILSVCQAGVLSHISSNVSIQLGLLGIVGLLSSARLAHSGLSRPGLSWTLVYSTKSPFRY